MLIPSLNTGIDSYERALIWSAMLLYQGIKDDSNTAKRDTITLVLPKSNTAIAPFTIEARFEIDRLESVMLGGNFIETILPINALAPTIDIDCGASENSFIPLDPTPDYIDSLEKYFAWLCHIVKAELIENDNEKVSNIETQFFLENSQFPQIRFKVTLDVDYLCYLRNNNILCCVLPLLLNDPYTPPPPDSNLPEGCNPDLGNESDVGNDSNVGNCDGSVPEGSLGNGFDMGNNSTMGNQGATGNDSTLGNNSDLGNNSNLGN